MEVTTFWWIALAVAAAVAVLVAVLLVAILVTARGIERRAADVWMIGKQIAGNTVSIWLLDRTGKRLEQTDDRVRSLVQSVRDLDEWVRAIAADRRGG